MKPSLSHTFLVWLLLCTVTKALYHSDAGLLFIPLATLLCVIALWYRPAGKRRVRLLIPLLGGYVLIACLAGIYVLSEAYIPFNLLFQALGLLSITGVLALFSPALGYSLKQPAYYTSFAVFLVLSGITEALHALPPVRKVLPYFYILICLWQLSIFIYIHLLTRRQQHTI